MEDDFLEDGGQGSKAGEIDPALGIEVISDVDL